MKLIPKFIVLSAVLIAGCHSDLWTKQWAMKTFQDKESVTIVEDYIDASYAENDGMVFGVLGEHDLPFKNRILAGLTMISILFIVYLIWRVRNLSFAYILPFFLILSGAGGNLIDRIRYGHVVDFIHIHWKDSVEWPFLFNVADVWICVGAGLLLLLVIFKKKMYREVLYS